MNETAPHEAPYKAPHPQRLPGGDTLAELLRAIASAPEMTPRERWQQRVGFAYGNVALHNPAVTRAMVEAEAARVYGPCPGDEDPAAARPSAWSRSVPSEDGFWWLRAPGDGASVCRKVGANFYLVGEDVALRAGDFLPTTEFARAEEPK